MAGSPRWKVYTPAGWTEPRPTYVAACKYIEDAAAVVALYGPGATIRRDHRTIVWMEGRDGVAADSYDAVAHHVSTRPNEHL